METLNIATLARYFTDEGAAWELVEKMRWPDGPVCPHCDAKNHAYLLANAPTRTGKVSYRRSWKCAECRRKFSVLVGTIFEDTKIPMHKWLLAMHLLSASKNGVAAYELHRTLGITHKTAWFMIHRIREGMKVAPFAAMMKGTIVADETWVGGKDKNRHAKDKRHHDDATKSIVLTLVEKDTHTARSKVVPDVQGFTLRKAMDDQVDVPNTVLHTDGHKGYEFIEWEFAGHESVNHVQGVYVRGDVSSNQVENYFSQFKRSVDGTHHHISGTHLPRYLAEFDFRYSTCKVTDTERMVKLMGQVGGRRLTYKRLTAKA